MEKTAAPRLWTVLSLLEWSADYLGARGIDSPRLTSELLLGRVLTLDRISLYTNFDRPLSVAELAAYKELLRRRTAREPVQYILGEAHFMGLRFAVNPDVLIPRPETELLVELVLELAKADPAGVREILDIGTGSGCIAVSIAHHLRACRVDAIDVSPEALRTAAKNARAARVEDRVRFSLADALAEPFRAPEGPYDLVVANPPYISEAEFALLQPEVREFEPALATTDRGDGLTFYRAIARAFGRIARPGGWCLVEVAYDQAEAVRTLFLDAGAAGAEALPDYAGIPRVVRVRAPGEPA